MLPIYVFAQSWGYSNNDFGTALCKSDDNIFITGFTKLDKIQNSDDVFILKLNLNSGKYIFKTFNYKYNDRAYGISMINKNIIISGESFCGFGNIYGRENGFVLNLSQNFYIKDKIVPYFTARDAFLKTKELSNGDLLSVGYSRTFNTGLHSIGDVFILKTSPNFDTLWHKAYYSAGNDYCADFVELQNRDIVLLTNIGGFVNSNQADYRYTKDSQIGFIKIDEDANELERILWGGEGHDFASEIIKSPDNSGYYIVGSTQSFGNGNFDVLLLKVDNNFNEIWYKTFGDTSFDYGKSIVYSNIDQHLYLLSSESNPKTKEVKTVLYNLDLDGNVIDTQEFKLNKYTYAANLIVDKDGKLYILGNCYENRNDVNMFLLSHNPNDSEENFFFKKLLVKVFPNPVLAGNELFFQLQNFNFNTEKSIKISISDLSGRLLLTKEVTTFKQFSINTSGFKKGMYFYSIQFDKFDYLFGKFLVEE